MKNSSKNINILHGDLYVHTKTRGAENPLTVYTAGLAHPQERIDRPEGAPRYHFMFVESGEGFAQDETGRYSLTQGSALYIPKNYPVSYYSGKGKMRTAWITLDGAVADMIISYYGGDRMAICPDSGIHSKIAECARILERGTAQDKLSALAYELIVLFFTDLEYSKTPSELLTAKRYIDESYMHDLSVADVARAVGISESLLYRLFREEEGITPVGYLREVRIKRAERMLLGNPDMRVGDVASACGFLDSSYFCKLFRERNGVSPRKYRTHVGL